MSPNPHADARDGDAVGGKGVERRSAAKSANRTCRLESHLSHKSRSRTPSPLVTSTQAGSHPDLIKALRRHRRAAFSKAISDHTRDSFSWVREVIARQPRPLVLDSGCGVGESTRELAERHPDHWVIGVEKSALRLRKGGWVEPGRCVGNLILIRAELADFWRQALANGWRLERHYLLYPNPWPKPGHLMRRWHAHPVFETLLDLGGVLELRTNWRTYAKEFVCALEFFDHHPTEVQYFEPLDCLTPFERKFDASGHQLFKVTVDLGSTEC